MGHRNEVPGWCVKKLRRDTNLFSCQILLCALNECHHHQDAVQTRKPITSERMPSCIGEVESIHMSEFLFSNFFFVCKSCIHIGNETVAVQMCRSTSKKNQNIQFLIQALARSTRRTTTLTEHILIDTLQGFFYSTANTSDSTTTDYIYNFSRDCSKTDKCDLARVMAELWHWGCFARQL